MNTVRAALGILLVALAGSAARAQATGSIHVHVVDVRGEPLPGAQVTISHEAGNIKPFTQVTDRRGIAEFPVLRPGTGYVIAAMMPSFGARRETAIRVAIGETTIVALQLGDEMQEHIRVLAQDNKVDLERTSSLTRFSDSFIQDLPVPGRFYQNILTLAAGVQDPDGDGNPIVHGSRSRDFRAEVGGVSNVDPLTGQFMSLINADSIEEIEVITAGAGVEFGRAQGGFARIVQRQGTNEFEGNFGLLLRSSKLDGSGASDVSNLPEPEFDEFHPSGQVSGPIVKDRMWYRLSFELLDQEEPINVVDAVEVQTRKQEIQAYQATWQASPRNKLAYQWQSDPLVVDNFGVSSSTRPESTLTIDTGTRTHSLTWTAPYSPKLLVESTVAWQERVTNLSPTVVGQPNDCVIGDAFLEQAQCTNLITQETSGSHFITNDDRSQRLMVRTQATLYGGRMWGANHQFKFGFVSENERFFRTLERRPSVSFSVINPLSVPGEEASPEEIYLIAATLAVPRNSRTEATGTNWSAYVEDQIKPLNNLVITVGGRIDREEINTGGKRPFDPAQEGREFLEALSNSPLPQDALLRRAFTAYEGLEDFKEELGRVTGRPPTQILTSLSSITLQSEFWRKQRVAENVNISNTNFSPFLSVAWDPGGNGKNKLAVSARRYYDKIFLSIPMIEVNPATTNLVFQAESSGDGRVEPFRLRSTINPVVSVDTVDRDLRTPYGDEFRLVYERSLWTETQVRAEYIRRKYRDQFQNIDLNHLPGDFGRCRRADVNDPSGIIGSPGAGQELTDPETGQTYIDTDPGIGDGLEDDCVGTTRVAAGDPELFFERPDGVADLYLQNPGWGQYLMVGNFNESDYEGIVLELVRRQYRGWEMQTSYTWSISEGNGEDFQQFLGLDRSILDNEYGFQSSDQRHVVKVLATTITPWGFRLGGTATWQSGLPYSLLEQKLAFDKVPWPYLIQSFRPARNRLEYPTGVRNSGRNDSQWLFDLKLTKELNLARALNLQFSAEVFNVLDDATYEIYNPDLETGYRINGVNNARREFGRRWQLGARIAF